MRGLTQSPRAYGFGRVPPYHMYYLRRQAQTFFQDVLRGVYVPVVDCTAHRASPFSNGQVLCTGPLCAASGAKLRRREETADSDDPFPVPVRLILQLPPELAPGSVGDGPRQFVVLHHVGRR